MLRLLVLVLLLVNGALLAARWGLFGALVAAGAQREPERLQHQLRPDAVQILPAQLAVATPVLATNAATSAATNPASAPVAAASMPPAAAASRRAAAASP